MNQLTIKFVDFWKGFDHKENIFTRVLQQKYNLTILDNTTTIEPQLLIYSAFGSEHIKYKCLKIYYTGENDVPDFNQCDYALSAHYLELGDRHMRMPQYLLYSEYHKILTQQPAIVSNATKRPFCSVVVSNSTYVSPFRNAFIDAVDNYKPLAYGGAYRNNVGGRVPDKMAFIRNYKFNLALENSMVEGYTTEKIVEPMAASTIPIYWGNKSVTKEFNPEAFINAANYDTMDHAIDAIARIDNDDDAYMKMLCAPKIVSDCRIDWDELLLSFFTHIIEKGRRYVEPYGYLGHLDYMRQRKELLYANKWLRKCASAILKRKK